MNSGLRLWVPILLVSAVLALGLGPSAKADAIYSYTLPGEVSWSFEVPAIITTNFTSISSFLSFNVVSGGHLDKTGIFGELSCGSLPTFATLIPQQQGFLIPPQIHTGVGICLIADGAFPTFTSFGTFTDGFGTLTISESQSAVPEPSSLLLLAGGLTGLLGLRRKRIG